MTLSLKQQVFLAQGYNQNTSPQGLHQTEFDGRSIDQNTQIPQNNVPTYQSYRLWKLLGTIGFVLMFGSLIFLLTFMAQTVTPNPVIVANHQYFVNENFEINSDRSYWEGDFSNGYYETTVTSNKATLQISLAPWNTYQPLYFNMRADSSAFVQIKSSQGVVLFSSAATGSSVINVTDYFVGYKRAVVSQAITLDGNSYAPEYPLILELDAGTYKSIQLYSEVTYSLLADSYFRMSLAVTNRDMRGTEMGDKPIWLGEGNTYASLINPNARATKIFDLNSFTVDGITPQEATDMAGAEITLPLAPRLTFDYSAALSYKGVYNENEANFTDVQYRIHFLEHANPVVAPETAVTAWESVSRGSYLFDLNTLSTQGFGGYLQDISFLAGRTGRFAIEIDANWQYNLPEFRPFGDVYFVLLEMSINADVNDHPRPYTSTINFATDFAKLSHGNIEAWYDDRSIGAFSNALSSVRPVLRATEAADIATYMIDTTQVINVNDFSDGNYYRDFAVDSVSDATNWVYDESRSSVALPGHPDFPDTGRLLYRGLDQQSRMWDRDAYLYSIEIMPDSVDQDLAVGIVDMGVAIGSSSDNKHYGIRYVDDRRPGYVSAGNYVSKVEFYRYHRQGPKWGETLLDTFEFDGLLNLYQPLRMHVMDVGVLGSHGYEVWIAQGGQIYYAKTFMTTDNWAVTSRDQFYLIGQFGEVQHIQISAVEKDLMSKIYVTADNPSDTAITLTAKLSIPGYPQREVGSVLIEANSGLNVWAIAIDPNIEWRFTDRLIFEKDQDAKPLLLHAFQFDGTKQPYFDASLAFYYRLGANVKVDFDSVNGRVYSNDRPTMIDYAADIFSDPSFESLGMTSLWSTAGAIAFNPWSEGAVGGFTAQITQTLDHDLAKVADGIASSFLETDATNDLVVEIQLNLDHTTGSSSVPYTQFSYSYRTEHFISASNGESDYLEIYLVHYDSLGGAIDAIVYAIDPEFQRFEATDFSSDALDGQVSAPLVQNKWHDAIIDLSDILTNSTYRDDNWYLRVSVQKGSGVTADERTFGGHRTAEFPRVRIDQLQIYNTPDVALVSSIDAYLVAGPNRLELTGLPSVKQTNTGPVPATFQIALRKLDQGWNNDENWFIVGESIELNLYAGSGYLDEITFGTTFELAESGKYEVAVFWDTNADQADIYYELYTISNTGPRSLANAWDFENDGRSTSGIYSDFGADASRNIYSSDYFQESISYQKNNFYNLYGPRTGSFIEDGTWQFEYNLDNNDPTHTSTLSGQSNDPVSLLLWDGSITSIDFTHKGSVSPVNGELFFDINGATETGFG